MKNIIPKRLSITSALAFTQVSYAGNVNWGGGASTDDWNDDGNWSSSPSVPGVDPTDKIIFSGAGDSNSPTSDFTFANAINLTGRNSSVVTIQAGVTISNFNTWRLGANNANGGGQVTMTGGGLSGINFQVATNTGATSRSIFDISDGSLTTSSLFSIGSLGDFNLTGDDATFSVGSFTTDGGSQFNVTLDDTGISKVDASGIFTIDSGANLNLDLSAFTGTGSFELVGFASSTGTYDVANISGLDSITGAGRTASISYDSDSMNLNINAVPEPSSTALLGLGVFSLTLRRSRP